MLPLSQKSVFLDYKSVMKNMMKAGVKEGVVVGGSKLRYEKLIGRQMEAKRRCRTKLG